MLCSYAMQNKDVSVCLFCIALFLKGLKHDALFIRSEVLQHALR